MVPEYLWPVDCRWSSPGQNTGVGSLSLLQGIFPTQGSNSGLPHCGQILYQLSHKGSPRILEWVAVPVSRGSSQPRSPALQEDSSTAEPQGKSRNTRVGNLFLLQGIFPTQELNQSFLHCRQILYQLSYQRIDNGKMMIFWDWVSGFQSRVQFLSYMGSEKLFSLSVPQVSHL